MTRKEKKEAKRLEKERKQRQEYYKEFPEYDKRVRDIDSRMHQLYTNEVFTRMEKVADTPEYENEVKELVQESIQDYKDFYELGQITKDEMDTELEYLSSKQAYNDYFDDYLYYYAKDNVKDNPGKEYTENYNKLKTEREEMIKKVKAGY